MEEIELDLSEFPDRPEDMSSEEKERFSQVMDNLTAAIIKLSSTDTETDG